MRGALLALALLATLVVADNARFEYILDTKNPLASGTHTFRPPNSTGEYASVAFQLDASDNGLRVSFNYGKAPMPFLVLTVLDTVTKEIKAVRKYTDIPITAMSWPQEGKSELNINLPEVDDSLTFIAELIPREVNTYEYELANVHTLKSGNYDLKPANASLGTYFVISLDQDHLSWFVKRKAPIPDCIFTLWDSSHKILAQQAIMHIPAEGMGFSKLFNLNNTEHNPDFKVITFQVDFYEQYREYRAETTVHEIWNVVDKLKDPNDSNDREYFPTTLPDVKLQLRHYPETKHVAFTVVQPGPIRDLQMRVLDDSGQTIFLEEERQVPFITHEEDTQFGWYHVIPEDQASAFFKTTNVHVILTFNSRAHQSQTETLLDFLTDNGADVSKIEIKEHAGKRGVFLKENIEGGTIFSHIPYRLLVTHVIAKGYEWWKNHIETSESWKAFVSSKNVGEATANIVALTFFGLLRPNSPFDGTPFRLFFEAFPTTAPTQPMFWTEEERALLRASHIDEEVDQQKDFWQQEYKAISEAVEWFGQHVKQEEYERFRGHVISKLYNASGTVLLLPVVDMINHDDGPNVNIRFDDQKRLLEIFTLQTIPAGAQLTINYGLESKTKHEFLVQYGFVPVGAPDAVRVEDVTMTDVKSTRFLLYEKYLKSHNNNLRATYETLKRLFQEKLQSYPSHVHAGPEVDPVKVLYANRILNGEKSVLTKHIAWLEDDLADRA